MTNILIYYPDIPQSATDYWIPSTNGADTEDMPYLNTFRGERYQFWKSEISGGATTHQIDYRLSPSSGGKSASFLLVSRLDILKNLAGSTIAMTLERSSDGVSYTAEQTVADVSAASLTGVWGNDYLGTFTESSAYEYWRFQLEVTAGSDCNIKVGKVYFGNAFDMGIDPVPLEVKRQETGEVEFVSDGGIIYPGRVKQPTYDITLEWEGVADTTTTSFFSDIANKRHTTTYFLNASTFDDVLDGQSLIHCKLVSVEQSRAYEDWNRIVCRFVECHG